MNWKTLEIKDKKIIDEYTKGKFTISDLNFTNFLIWSSSEKIEFLEKDSILLIRGEFEGLKYYFVPMSKKGIDDKEKIEEAMIELYNRKEKIVFIPEEYKEALENKFVFQELRDTFDYIYNMESLSLLKGRNYSEKRNKINGFKKLYNYSYEKLSDNNIEEIEEFQKEWIIKNEKHKDRIIVAESIGITLLLKNYKQLGIVGGVIRIDGKIIAYALGERLNDEMAVIHIEKALIEYKGSYQMINYYFSKEEFKDMKYINREDDFGNEGLRIAKLSYLPAKLLKKYEILDLR
ncbi:MAG: phosphatidylglycerol lysyltransferase domain-containing protein [Cetobacterium sp.]|uniref:DUF2156 domain-containing protein n=1 Tax=unclassified Cetobacterium TaxID=2630983 RepID=UPI00163B6E02|nr:phosphatidylglycerol lysyltransferase domain-containing protein [Cetobacterium sp. 2A]MBC2856730.1 DUF2156 domain-containing protein [Cetobacterium sp. 2A]